MTTKNQVRDLANYVGWQLGYCHTMSNYYKQKAIMVDGADRQVAARIALRHSSEFYGKYLACKGVLYQSIFDNVETVFNEARENGVNCALSEIKIMEAVK